MQRTETQQCRAEHESSSRNIYGLVSANGAGTATNSCSHQDWALLCFEWLGWGGECTKTLPGSPQAVCPALGGLSSPPRGPGALQAAIYNTRASTLLHTAAVWGCGAVKEQQDFLQAEEKQNPKSPLLKRSPHFLYSTSCKWEKTWFCWCKGS